MIFYRFSLNTVETQKKMTRGVDSHLLVRYLSVLKNLKLTTFIAGPL